MKDPRMVVVTVAIGALLAGVAWIKPLASLRGDETKVVEAAKAADEAEAALESKRNEVTAANAAADLTRLGTDLLVRFAEQLPEVPIEGVSQPIHIWYERQIMTPAELSAYHDGSSNETFAADPPTWFTNNPTCYTEPGTRTGFDWALCTEQPDPTVVIGKSSVEIGLTGFNGDCRAALGFVFSRVFETVRLPGGQGFRPSGYHFKPWVAPGTFTATVPNCVTERPVQALRSDEDITYGSWPLSAEEYQNGVAARAEEARRESSRGGGIGSLAEVTVNVSFDLLFRPAHSLLCVPNLAGYRAVPEPDPETGEVLPPPMCPAAGWLAAADEERRLNQGPFISDRVCLPRLPVATAFEKGEETVARYDREGWPSAFYADWPASLEECSIHPVPVPPR